MSEWNLRELEILRDFHADICGRVGLQEPVRLSLEHTNKLLGRLILEEVETRKESVKAAEVDPSSEIG